MYENWAVSFKLWKADLIYNELKNLTTKQNKPSSGFNAAFYNCFSSGWKTLCHVIFAEK